MSSALDNEFFPYEVVRKEQDKLISDVKNALNDEKILIAHAPTGLGKTASALCVALKVAIPKKKKIFFLTNRHTQHQIAVETLKHIKNKTGKNISCVDLIGKKWMCNQEVAGLYGNEFNEYCKSVVEKGECEFYNNVKNNKGLTVEAEKLVKDIQRPLHNEEIISLSQEKRMCSYEISIAAAKKADVFIGDYNYIFNPFVQSTIFKKMEIEMEDVIVIVDEGHNLPGRIMDMNSCNLTTNMLKNALIEAKKFGFKGVIFWLQEINRILTEFARFEGYEKEKLLDKESFINAIKKVVDYDSLVFELEEAADEIRKKQRRSYLGGISTFLDSWKGEDTGFTRILSQVQGRQGEVTMLSYACLDPSLITKDIFKTVHSGVIMSGTLQPTFMFKDLLGISGCIEKEYDSPFPPENKLSLIIPETSTKYNVRSDEMFQKIAKKCSEISSLVPGNIAFFFPSYNLRDKIGIYFETSKKKFWEKSDMNKEEKENLLDEFKEEKVKGGVLLGVAGANFAEGIDFPGNLLNGVVVVGLPLGRPDLKTKEIIAYYDTKFGKGWNYGYIYPAMSKCIQSAGRCIRSEKDTGVVIYLEERFAWERYYSCLPREGLRVTKEYAGILKEFFK